MPVDTSSTLPTTRPPVPARQPAEPSRMLSTCHHHAKGRVVVVEPGLDVGFTRRQPRDVDRRLTRPARIRRLARTFVQLVPPSMLHVHVRGVAQHAIVLIEPNRRRESPEKSTDGVIRLRVHDDVEPRQSLLTTAIRPGAARHVARVLAARVAALHDDPLRGIARAVRAVVDHRPARRQHAAVEVLEETGDVRRVARRVAGLQVRVQEPVLDRNGALPRGTPRGSVPPPVS